MQQDEQIRAIEIRRGRQEILSQLEDWLEGRMILLGFVWLVLLVIELVWSVTPGLERLGTVIWIIFIVDFTVRFIVAPSKRRFLRSNWLTALALRIPALRVFRLVRFVRVLRAARATRGLRLVRLVTSLNRGMRALGAAMRRRGFGYVLILTGLVTAVGAAGMYAFEDRFPTYGACLVDSYAHEHYGFGLLAADSGRPAALSVPIDLLPRGIRVHHCDNRYVFIGRDAEDPEAELPGAQELSRLHTEIASLRDEIRNWRASQPS